MSDGDLICVEGKTGDTALMNTIVGDHFDSFKLLIAQGADISYEGKNGRGFTPLMFAVFNQREAMVQYLISHKCRINRASRKAGWTAKDIARKVGNERILEMLMSAPQDSAWDWEMVREKAWDKLFLYGPICILIVLLLYIYFFTRGDPSESRTLY